jgi:hypothetical protein
MLSFARHRKPRNHRVVEAAATAASHSMFEQLENRQHLSVTMDVRMPGGGKQAAATSVGQVIRMEAWATVSGANGISSDEGFQLAQGSFVSGDVSGGSVSGTLSVTRTYPFTGAGSQNGGQQDLDGDGDLDVGSANSSSITNYFMARADVLQGGSSFKIADVTFTVTGLKGGRETDIVFVPRPTKAGLIGSYATGVWREDGVRKGTLGATSNSVAGLFAGSGVFLTRSGSGGTGGGGWDGGGGGGGGGGGTTPGSISGNVWKDNNANGVRDAGEPNFSSFQLYLDNNRNGLKDSTEPTAWTDGNGNYTFSSLGANVTYRVRAFPPSGWGTSFPYQPTPWHDVFVGSGQNVSGKHFGEKPLGGGGGTTPGSIAGSVFKDNNSNGTWDNGEPSFPGFQLYIDSNYNGLKDSSEPTTWSDGSGNYKFFNLAGNATYRVRAFPPSGWGPASPNPPRGTMSSSAQVRTSPASISARSPPPASRSAPSPAASGRTPTPTAGGTPARSPSPASSSTSTATGTA